MVVEIKAKIRVFDTNGVDSEAIEHALFRALEDAGYEVELIERWEDDRTENGNGLIKTEADVEIYTESIEGPIGGKFYKLEKLKAGHVISATVELKAERW